MRHLRSSYGWHFLPPETEDLHIKIGIFKSPAPQDSWITYLCAPTLTSSISFSGSAVDLCGIRFLPETPEGCNFADPVAIYLVMLHPTQSQDGIPLHVLSCLCCLRAPEWPHFRCSSWSIHHCRWSLPAWCMAGNAWICCSASTVFAYPTDIDSRFTAEFFIAPISYADECGTSCFLMN